jgi:cyclic-di-AMP phosphodiesterase PgpH
MPEHARTRLLRALRDFWDVASEKLGAIGRSRTGGWLGVCLLAVVLTAITTTSFQQLPSAIRVGMIAAHDIKANRNYEIVDEEASASMRDEAMSSVLPVFDMDADLGGALTARLHETFRSARQLLESQPLPERGKGRQRASEPGAATPSDIRGELRALFEDRMGVKLGDPELAALAADRLSPRAEGAVAGFLKRILAQPLLADRTMDEIKAEKGAIVRRIQGAQGEQAPSTEEAPIADISRLPTLLEVQKTLEAAPEFRGGFRDPKASAALRALASAILKPNCMLDVAETARRRESAAASTKGVIIKINAGEMIIREGARFEPWHMKVLAGIQKERRSGTEGLEFLGTFILALLVLVVPFRALKKFSRRVRLERTDMVLMAAVGIAVLLLVRLTFVLAPAVRDQFFFSVDVTALYYAAPVAGGAMLLRMFLGMEVSFVFALILSVLAGFFIETDVRYLIFSLATSMVALMTIAGVDRRSLIMRAGAITGAAGAAAVVGISLVAGTAQGGFSLSFLAGSAFFAFLGGIGCAVFAMIAAPLVEVVSGFTSDIKLLELANLNHPLLRELVVRAPGTYHHSHLVGLLGEAAATAIGANALLVRVGAYYHDIGKLRKPLYFIENIKGGENRHERLTPHMSALIVGAHVKEGVDLAASAKVPKVITDMIPQHHGTRRISFFYDKAKSQEDPELMKVDPKDFSYGGPKPQTREAAILMLADVAEAAVRALKEKSPTRIEQTVRKTIHDIFNESQLDECDLTLRDLNEIGMAFERTLLGIYHLRIEYTKDMDHDRSETIVDEVPPGAAHSAAKRPPPDASESS